MKPTIWSGLPATCARTVPPSPVPNAANPSAVMVTSFKFAVREPCKMIASRGDVVGVDERRGVIFGLRVFVFKDL